MHAQFTCLLLLCFTCGALCTDVNQDQRAMEEELLNNLFNSKMKQNRNSAPYWRVSLNNLCRMVGSLQPEQGSSEEEDGELLEELYNLQHICQAQQGRGERLLHDSLEYLEENGESPLKRKSPYILKRQATHTTKSRRPYILKRNTIY